MYNNLTFLSKPVNRVQLLTHLTLWTFSVGSYKRGNKLYFYEDELYKWIEGGKQYSNNTNSEEMLNNLRKHVRHLPSSIR